MRSALLLGIVAITSAAATVQQPTQSIDTPPGASLLLEAKGEGTQVYTCTDSHWVFKAPDAKLLDARGRVIGKHFAGPTWRLNDDSEVKGKLIASQPAPDGKSIPWLLIGAVPGSGSGRFASVAYVRRTETSGGAAPKEACTSGELAVPYAAKYTFFASK
jgi:hypothetical protein